MNSTHGFNKMGETFENMKKLSISGDFEQKLKIEKTDMFARTFFDVFWYIHVDPTPIE